MIRLEGYMEMVQMRRNGVSISEISKRTGFDRKTVRKYLKEGFPVEKRSRKKRVSKLDPFKDYLLKRMLSDGVLNATVLLDEIRERGYSGGISILRDFMRPIREREREASVFRRVLVDPGAQFQVDWAHFKFAGEVIYCFCALLSHSGYRFIRFFPRQDLEHFLEGHILFFERIGFIPREGLYDNLKSVILKRIKREKVLNPKFLSFSCQMGFYPRVCLPYSPTSKGKVENLIGYVRKNFWVRYASSCEDLWELNEAADRWLEKVNGRVHGRTGRAPFDLLYEERCEGIALFDEIRPYKNAYRTHRRVFKDATLSYKGVRYSVPYVYARKIVEVEEPLSERKIYVYKGAELIATHDVPVGPEKLVIDPSHYRGMPYRTRLSRTSESNEKGDVLPAGPGIPSGMRAPVVQERSLSEYESFFWEVTS